MYTGSSIGGVSLYLVVANVIISHSKFLNNTLLCYNPGTIIAYIAKLLIMHTTFMNNSANLHFCSGGIILVRESANTTIAHSNFFNNIALGPEEGIIILENYDFHTNATVAYSHFSNNEELFSCM